MYTHLKLGRIQWSTTVLVLAVLVATGTTVGIIAASSANSQSAPGTDSHALPADKQALIDRSNALRAQNNPSAVAPDTLAAAKYAQQPCTRDVSQIISGLGGARGGLDFPDWRSYAFNNEWADPAGTIAILAGNVVNQGQGAVAIEYWAPPTSCRPTAKVAVAPTNSGSLTIKNVSGGNVELVSSTGVTWRLDLTNLRFAQVTP